MEQSSNFPSYVGGGDLWEEPIPDKPRRSWLNYFLMAVLIGTVIAWLTCASQAQAIVEPPPVTAEPPPTVVVPPTINNLTKCFTMDNFKKIAIQFQLAPLMMGKSEHNHIFIFVNPQKSWLLAYIKDDTNMICAIDSGNDYRLNEKLFQQKTPDKNEGKASYHEIISSFRP